MHNGGFPMDIKRYSRQMSFRQIKKEGQEKLLKSRVVIIGIGALGTVIANNLCRAGVGFIRLVDRDLVELSNIQRQTLYDEEDAKNGIPKAFAAFEHLSKINSGITIEPIIADANSSNIEDFISDVDLVLDGSDNIEIRYLINEACVKLNKPWIYGGALESYGMTMNIIPGTTPCFKCAFPEYETSESHRTCSTVGVINSITGLISCVESSEALKILIGSDKVRNSLMVVDLWQNATDYIEIKIDEECPICIKHQYEYLGKVTGSYTKSLCGTDSIQVIPAKKIQIDFNKIAKGLEKVGTVDFNQFMLTYSDDKTEFSLFKDGRAIIKKAADELSAKSIYAEYIGF